MGQFALNLLALVVTALSLAPSFAHVLEALPRLTAWSPELWREATVFGGQFQLFAVVGAPLDIGAILVPATLAYVLRNDRPAFRFAAAGAVLFAASLVVWMGWVAPANRVLATWRPGPVPEDFFLIRNRWETGHMVIAAIKLTGFVAVALSVLTSRSRGMPAR